MQRTFSAPLDGLRVAGIEVLSADGCVPQITGLGWVDDCLEVASVETPPPLPRVVVLGTDATTEVE